MAHGLDAALIVKEEEGAARLTVIAPHLAGALVTDECRFTEGDLYIGGRQPRDPGRFSGRRRHNGLLR
jgi:hypothetical protein